MEHIGRTLRVTSPGGFFGGVEPGNIITHPSMSRNRALTQLLADLRVAERQGIGVDRMVREMVRLGHPRPEIEEIPGPYVRTTLVGESLDEPWMTWLGKVEPRHLTQDVSAVLVLRHLVERVWIDERMAARLTQVSPTEARSVLDRLRAATAGDAFLVELAAGTPDAAPPVWKLSDAAKQLLTARWTLRSAATARHRPGVPWPWTSRVSAGGSAPPSWPRWSAATPPTWLHPASAGGRRGHGALHSVASRARLLLPLGAGEGRGRPGGRRGRGITFWTRKLWRAGAGACSHNFRARLSLGSRRAGGEHLVCRDLRAQLRCGAATTAWTHTSSQLTLQLLRPTMRSAKIDAGGWKARAGEERR